MKEKILAFLKTKLNGVPDVFLLVQAEHFSKAIKDEKDIETTLNDGVIDLIKANASLLQTEGDKRATEAQKTALKNFQEKHGLDENGKLIEDPTKKKKTKDGDPDEPAWFKTYRETKDAELADLKTKLEAQVQEKTSAALIEKVKAHEKLKDIPASYLKSRNLIPKSEAEIDQLASEILTDYTSLKQELVEKGAMIPTAPPTGGGQQGDKSTIDDYLKEKFPEDSKVNNLVKT